MFARLAPAMEVTAALGAALAPALAVGDVLALEGDLGAGKTCFVTGLARGLDCKARVRSPTFGLVHVYHGRLTLAHVDLYRVEPGGLESLGLEELAEEGALVVEWGDRLPAAWRAGALILSFTAPDPGSRRIEASARSGRGLDLLRAWEALDVGAPEAR